MCNTGLYQRGPTFSTSSYYYGLSYFGAVMLVYSMSQLPPKLFTEVLHCNLPWQELSKIPAGNAHLYTGVWPGFRSWNQPFLWQKILHWQVSVAQLKAPFDLFNRWLECIVLWVKSPQNPLNFLMFNIPMLMLQSETIETWRFNQEKRSFMGFIADLWRLGPRIFQACEQKRTYLLRTLRFVAIYT